jgi:hypothetical protein
MRLRFSAAAAALGLLAAACSSGDGKEAKTTRTTRAATTSTGAAAPADVAPLTGLPSDAAHLGRPALIVKIDNYAAKSYPQFGIGSADVVVEEGVEGGITRLAAIFQSHDADRVGPVRSARSTDIHIGATLGRPLFAYSGTNGNFQALIDRSPLINISPNKLPGAYHRDSSRPAPYNLFSGTPALYAATPSGTPATKPLFAAGTNEGGGSPVKRLELRWIDKVRTDVAWGWDGQKWSRVQNGQATVDGSGAAVAPRNIVVMFINYVDTGERDQSNSTVPEGQLIGSGEAWVVRDGAYVKGKWTKASDTASIELTDAKGDRLKLLAGQTWVELPAPGNASIA